MEIPGIESAISSKTLWSQEVVSVQNIPESNVKFYRSAYDVNAYVGLLAIAIRPSDGKGLAVRLVPLEKSRLMPAPGFPFTLPRRVSYTTPQYNTYTRSLILDEFSRLQFYVNLQCS